ncbi:MAG: YebC/PmpR family DNA-binding transcriptional regulator [Phycisphaeraceae bacterium]|nr:YebC/PmpR family DNA-binding transcriptional regulator [Phycisphaerales bacterium]MCB9860236.1 YebC/PmpR family DNA-binding transcriptional regulator [Phycisphaeraceae bacterium]
MAGHSKWANIRHKKAAVDKKRGRMWSKCSRAIMAAAREGGGDPASNLALRYAIDEARYANMPKDTIERAVKKGAGELGGGKMESVRYEGYGPNGVAIIADALTDNRNRTAPEVKMVFSKYNGNMGASGSVAYSFDTVGQILVEAGKTTEDVVINAAIDAGATDVEAPEDDDGFWVVSTEPTQFHAVREALENAKIEISSAEIALIPQNTVAVAGDDAKKVLTLIDALEELEDVQKVYSNADISEEDYAAFDS